MNQLPKEKIKRLQEYFVMYKRNQDVSTNHIAKRLKIDSTTVSNYYKRIYGIEYSLIASKKKRKFSKEFIEKLFQEYKKKRISIKLLSNYHGLHEGTLSKYFLEFFGDEYRNISKSRITGKGLKRLSEKELLDIFNKYRNSNETLIGLAKQYGVCTRTLWKNLKKEFGDEFRNISKKKSVWNNKLSKQDIIDIFHRYKNGEMVSDLSKEYHVCRESILTRLSKTFGQEYKELSIKRRLIDSGRKRQKVNKEDIHKLFDLYKKSSISLRELADTVKIKENSLTSRFKKEFGREYSEISIKRRDERKISKKKCQYAFEKYKKTNISLPQLADELNMATSSIASRFSSLFRDEYKKIAMQKQDIVEVNRKGIIAEHIAIEYMKLVGINFKDVRRKKIFKSSFKSPDFISGNTFIEVKSYYINNIGLGRLKGYRDILNDYYGKILKENNSTILDKGIIISLSGFSPIIKKNAVKKNILLIGPSELKRVFKKNGRIELIELMKDL